MVRLFARARTPGWNMVRDRDSLQFIHPGWAYAQRDIAASTRAIFRSLETQKLWQRALSYLFFLTCGLCIWDLIMTSIFNRFHAIVTNYNNNMGRNKWQWSLKTLHRSICNIGVHFSAYCLLTRCVFRWGSTSSRWGNAASSLRVPSCGLQWQRPRVGWQKQNVGHST